MDYFRKLLDLLKIEREEDQRTYQELTLKLSLADRRTNGLSWFPVAIRGTEMSRGDYITVELERTTHQYVVHQFRFGAAARLFSNHNAGTDFVDGVIAYQGSDRMKITLRTDELPDWTRDGKLGIDLLFDDNSYDEMQAALRQATAIAEKPEGHLLRILTGQAAPTFNSSVPDLQLGNLNESQQNAVHKITAANELAIVHGPPGTGKTTTLIQAIKQLYQLDKKQILVVAPSNAAVDLLTEKLYDEGMNVLRVGNPARVSERLMSLTLDSKMAEHSRMKEIKKMKKQAAEFRDMAHKYKRQFGKAERDQRKALFEEAKNIMKHVVTTEQYIIDDLISKAQVITATLVGSNHFTVRNLTYHTVVIDEAAQALEPACWIPILKAKKLILAGDHWQLSPTVKSAEAARQGLTTTLLQKCVELHPEAVVLLEEQYRMHSMIMGYSSQVFYAGKL
ncbi:MAG: AAA family ATPase, partial [Chitinophagaceae bacterium]|nr:AAA family ATPase [Chitinophagaceae bacterium]